MNRTRSSIRSILAPAAVKAGAVAATAVAAAALGLTAAFGATTSTPSRAAQPFTFALQPSSPAIAHRLPHARGKATITPGPLNDTMHVTVHGMPANAALTVRHPATHRALRRFVEPDRRPGSHAHGNGSATVRGIFDVETFSTITGAAPQRSRPPTNTTSDFGSTTPTSHSETGLRNPEPFHRS